MTTKYGDDAGAIGWTTFIKAVSDVSDEQVKASNNQNNNNAGGDGGGRAPPNVNAVRM